MRLTSAMWFAVFMLKETARGAYVSVVKSGAQQAGAIFIIQNQLNGLFNLYSPAPQSLIEIEDDDDRMFECVLKDVGQEQVDTYLQKQQNFDPDIWVIETESGVGSVSVNMISEI